MDLHESGPEINGGRTDEGQAGPDIRPAQAESDATLTSPAANPSQASEATSPPPPHLDTGPPPSRTDAGPFPAGADPGPPAAGAAPEPAEAEAAPRRSSRTGRNLPVAIAVGLLLGAVVIVTLFTVKATFLIPTGAAVVAGLWELSRALRSRQITIPLVPLVAGGTAMWTCAYWLGYRGLLAALMLSVIALVAWRLPRGAAGYLRDVTASVFALCYLPLAGVFVTLMVSEPAGAHRTFLFVVLTVCSDIGGYFAGIGLGRHLLAPAISPGKTWEGLTGSVAACLLAGGILLPVLLHGHAWQGLLLGAAAAGAAALGDLVESMIKRDLGIKDMGTVLPGHGGVLDRIDAMLLTAPVTWLLLLAFVPH